jgi:hypothetical protein
MTPPDPGGPSVTAEQQSLRMAAVIRNAIQRAIEQRRPKEAES